MKFAIQSSERQSHEAQTIVYHCIINQIERIIVNDPRKVSLDYIPVGRVDWVEAVMGKIETPNYYPDFLQEHLHRKIWQPEKWPHNVCFIKPADRHKRFTGFVTTGGWKGKKKGPWWASEIVKFTNEWRYYVANGEVRVAKWGSGNNESDAPILDIQWPTDFCGAVDFGSYPDGTIALIESNSPFSCGWYGPIADGEVYAKWLADGWNWLKMKNNIGEHRIL